MAGENACHAGPGMAEILAQLGAAAADSDPAYVTLIRLLTFGGRLPFACAVSSLTVREQGLLQRVIGDEALRLQPADAGPGKGNVLVTQSPQGRLSLGDTEPAGSRILGWLTLARSALEQVDEEVLAWEIAERSEQAHLDEILHGWSSTGLLADRVRQVADWVDRVETVLIYIGDQVFSRSDASTSTLLRGGLLARLERTPLASWAPPERLFVVAAHLLFTAGRAIRFEEFNGRQLSATALRAWLVSTWLRYAHAAGAAAPADLGGRPAESLAREISDLSDAVNQSGWVRFRRITGPTFAKTEIMTELPRQQRSHPSLPERVRRFAQRAVGCSPDPRLSGEQAIGEIAAAIAAQPPGQQGPLIERLLAAIVQAAVVETGADYGMSSAVRDITRLAPAGGDPLAAVLGLRKPDFFCCVMAHPRHDDAGLGRLLWLVAQRMQYNRWHFVPGNFDREDVPRQRHYFFPPAMPDLAEFSDLWHGGHIAAQVRYSVRAPGAQLWREPLNVRGNAYRGCFDIRAVRMGGRPFDREDLWAAVRYSGLVDALWRSVAARISSGDCAVPVISAFGQEWYEQSRWKTILADPLLTS